MERYVVVAILAAICGVGVGIAVGFVYASQVVPSEKAVISPHEAGENALNILSRMGVNADVVEVTPVSNASLYKVRMSLTEIRGTREEVFYLIQKDGKSILSYAFPIPTIGNFVVSESDICMEDGKPVVYFFGIPGCSHCVWEHPILKNVTAKFEGLISVHDNYNNTNADRDIFSRFSTGGYPTIVLGCKFYRTGSGETLGREEEANVLTALICELTNGKPENVCNAPEIRELRNQI